MADGDVQVDLNEAAVAALLDAAARAVIPGLADETADLARAFAPVQHRTDPMVHHHRPPGVGGALKASVAASGEEDADGYYAVVSSLWYGRFLDPKARQLRHLYPLLPSALYATVDGRTYNL